MSDANPKRKITETNLRPSNCPSCGDLMEAVSGVSAGSDSIAVRPHEGDPTLCFTCGALLLFGPQMELRSPTSEEALYVYTLWPLIRPMQDELIKNIAKRNRHV